MPGTIIDMHLHTTKGASDSMLTPDVLIDEATRVGLTGVNITEHDRMWEQWDLAAFREKHVDMFVSNGMEVSTDMGHILAVGLRGYSAGIRRLEHLRQVADAQGAFLIVAHPFRHYFDSVTAKRQGGEPFNLSPDQAAKLPVFQLVHGIEVLNGCNTARENYFALQVAKVLGKPGTGGSDAHPRRGATGRCGASGGARASIRSSTTLAQHRTDVKRYGNRCSVSSRIYRNLCR